MNCLELRRKKLADPRRLSDQALAHLEQCKACRAFAHRVDEGEARLSEMLHVPVPDGLAERVILGRKHGFSFVRRRHALVATILLTLGSGILYWKAAPAPDYARLAIEHVINEQESFTTTRDADPALLRKVLHDFGGELSSPLGQLRYIRHCPMPGGMAWHIVFDTGHGLATLLLILEPGIKAGSGAADAAGWHAVARPGGKGFYVIVTQSTELLEAVNQIVSQRIVWRT